LRRSLPSLHGRQLTPRVRYTIFRKCKSWHHGTDFMIGPRLLQNTLALFWNYFIELRQESILPLSVHLASNKA
jgi:hypothetical protein